MKGEEQPNKKRIYTTKTKNPYNITNITHMLYDKNRGQGSIYCSKGLLEAYRGYAKRVYDKSMADCLERALLNDMESHPVEEINIEINHFTEEMLDEVQQRLEVGIMYSEIKRLVEILDRIESTGQGNYKEFQYDLIKALKPAVKLRNPSTKLIVLLAAAEKHVDST